MGYLEHQGKQLHILYQWREHWISYDKHKDSQISAEEFISTLQMTHGFFFKIDQKTGKTRKSSKRRVREVKELVDELNMLVHYEKDKEEWVVNYTEAIYGLGTYLVGPDLSV